MALYPCVQCDEECVDCTIQCSCCDRWVHSACVPMDDALLLAWSDVSLKFLCKDCCFTDNKYDMAKALERSDSKTPFVMVHDDTDTRPGYGNKLISLLPDTDNQNAPLVAIVDTRNISSHIVRSIEIPLREIINSTTQCKIKEELEKYAVSSQRDVNGQLETLQHKIDKHIEDLSNQFTVVNQDIVSLRKDTEETISHEILEQKKDVIKLVNTLKSDLDKKMNNLSTNVVFVQSEVHKKIDKHIKDNRDQFTVVQQDIATLKKEMEEKISYEILENIRNFTKIVNTVNENLDEKVKNLTNNVGIIQSELRKTKLYVDNNVSMLSAQMVKHSNRLGDTAQG
ncbi:unnamed protein product [Mytilus edulis]|uniref:Zinc finger PHD-type domain-containing protein n=1 Tax=Mytilus edulis TaxID=6550 RepID=A0A8S3T333_MYTED|nr:unnamed protein product [Mytilus edulis]